VFSGLGRSKSKARPIALEAVLKFVGWSFVIYNALENDFIGATAG